MKKCRHRRVFTDHWMCERCGQPMGRSFLWHRGRQIVLVVFLASLATNGFLSVRFFSAGAWFLGTLSLAAIIILPRVVLWYVLVITPEGSIRLTMPTGWPKLFPRTFSRADFSRHPQLFLTAHPWSGWWRLYGREIAWLAIGLIPLGTAIFDRLYP